MVAHSIDVGDQTKSVDNPGGAPASTVEQRKEYEVVADSGIFKNGKTYKKGEKVELAIETAQAQIDAGDIKEIK